jgi:hypothetical protein
MFSLSLNLVIIMTLHCIYLFYIVVYCCSFRSIAKMERGNGAISQGSIVSTLCLDFRNDTLHRSTSIIQPQSLNIR